MNIGLLRYKIGYFYYLWARFTCMSKYLFIVIAAICLLYFCTDNARSLETIYRAETLMQEYPDSALCVLESINRSSLKSRYGKARYALLYSQALDKNYIDVDKDTLTSQALKFYQYRGKKQDRALAYYYSGRVYENAGKVDSAIIQYTHTENLLDSSSDAVLLGLTASALGRLYETQNFVDAAANKYIEAADYFSQAGRTRNVLISYSRVLGMLSIQRDFENHEHYYNRSVALAKKINDTVALLGLEQSKADCIINQYKDYRRALNILKQAAHSYNADEIPRSYFFLISNIYIRLNQPEKALYYLQPLIADMHDVPLRAQMEYMYMAGELYQATNNSSEAYDYNKKALKLCDSLYFIEKEHTIPELQAKYRTDQLAIHNKYLKRINQYQLYIAVIALVSMLFIFLWLMGQRRKRILQQEHEISEYLNVIARLKDEYEELQHDKRSKSNDETVSRRISFLKQILETTAEYGHNKETFYTKIEQLFTSNGTGKTQSGSSNEMLLIFQDVLNARTQGIIEYLRRKYPSLSNQELSLYCMIVMNISKTAICFVLNISQKTYYNYRILLRNKLNITNEEITIESHYRMLCEEYEALKE